MAILFVLLLDSLPVVYGQALLERLHTFDLEACDVVATPLREGLEVDCRLTVRILRPGPLRFLLSRDVAGLTVTEGGRPVAAALGAGGFETFLRLFSGEVKGVPSLLTLEPGRRLEKGERVALRLEYRWAPAGDGWFYADADGLQTHLSGFWLPTAAQARFSAKVALHTPLDALGPGKGVRTAQGWRFESSGPVQVVSLVAGRFHTVRRGPLSVHVPARWKKRAGALLDDLEACLGRLEAWFGPLDGPFALVVEPRAGNAPSFCADSFAVIDPRYLDPGVPRAVWLSLLAHECAHRWWGHRVAMPLVGEGGTWLREGLAEWSGVRVAGDLLGADAERDLWRRNVRAYFRRIDLRRVDLRRAAGGVALLHANEPTLKDATYLDPPEVPYFRGALVLRLLEHRRGAERFRAALRRLAAEPAARPVRLPEFAQLVDDAAAVAYYAETTRLPDLELRDVAAGDGWVRAAIVCNDPDWPGGRIPVRIETAAGAYEVAIAVRDGRGRLDWRGEGEPTRVELDPERIFLDPVRGNGEWRPR